MEQKYGFAGGMEKGMRMAILKYRTPRPIGKPMYLSAWQDVQRAIRVGLGAPSAPDARERARASAPSVFDRPRLDA